jgi:hypothetical protein
LNSRHELEKELFFPVQLASHNWLASRKTFTLLKYNGVERK